MANKKSLHQRLVSLVNCFRFSIVIAGALWAASCTPDVEQTDFNANLELIFSLDTVSFDTIFSGNVSITKRFRVYNPIRNAININRIFLETGTESAYELIINGREGKEFNDIRLLGNDSMLVLVRVFPEDKDADEPELIEENLFFQVGSGQSKVILESWGQDVSLLNGQIFNENITFTKGKPYLIRNSVLIDEGAVATIEAGTRFYSERESFIIVGGQIAATGTLEEPIIFANSRLDSRFEKSSGQWGGIVLLAESNENVMNYCIIRNALFGLNLNNELSTTTPQLSIRNSIIQNMTLSGIIALGANLSGENLLVTNCGESAVRIFGGGTYEFNHCTFALYPYESFREEPTLFLNDEITDNQGLTVSQDLQLTITNSIIWGNRNEEVGFALSGNNMVTLDQSYNLWKSSEELLGQNNSLFNQNPEHISPSMYRYGLKENSPARNAGQASAALFDLYGKARSAQPDLGAISFDPSLID